MARKLCWWRFAVMWGGLLLIQPAADALKNQILGEIRFYGLTRAESMAGVWVDGQYLGYVNELKGSKKILLLPGVHQFVFRETGYKPFRKDFTITPGHKDSYLIWMEKDPQAQYPTTPAEVKISVHPGRAAVFVDNHFVGHVDEFDGPGQAMLLSPGRHHFKIVLPGYKPFETDVTLLANQHFELKTDLFAGSILHTDPLLNRE
jgi:hypothetical protein